MKGKLKRSKKKKREREREMEKLQMVVGMNEIEGMY
jgi:uncharacterized protein YlxW (UPF0749 family)